MSEDDVLMAPALLHIGRTSQAGCQMSSYA